MHSINEEEEDTTTTTPIQQQKTPSPKSKAQCLPWAPRKKFHFRPDDDETSSMMSDMEL